MVNRNPAGMTSNPANLIFVISVPLVSYVLKEVAPAIAYVFRLTDLSYREGLRVLTGEWQWRLYEFYSSGLLGFNLQPHIAAIALRQHFIE